MKIYETHGLHNKTRAYSSWQHMKSRCNNPRHERYADWGGRGVKVCDRWSRSFAAFYDDMGERPADMTLDRIDNDRNYSCGKCDDCRANGWPANCRWATRSQQQRNRRRKITSEMAEDIRRRVQAGENTKAQLAREYGISKTAAGQIANGRWAA